MGIILRLITFIIFCLGFKVLELHGQSNLVTHNGMIILRDGDTLSATFSIDLANDLIQASMGGTTRAYSARQLEQFNYYDETLKANRYFFSLPFSDYSTYKVPTLFELIYNGHALSLLSRESLTIVNIPVYDAFSQRTMMTSQPRLIVDLYFRDMKGLIKRYRYRKRDLFSHFKEYEAEMKKFIKDNNLGYTEKEDIIKITEYFNKISKPKTAIPDEK